MRSILRVRALAVLAGVAACTGRPPAPVGTGPSRPVVMGFTATVDPARGVLEIVPDGAGGAGQALLAEVPAVRDGVAGSGPRDTVELVNAVPPATAAGCGGRSYEADVTLRSFYPNAQLERAYVEIVQMSSTGREACNGAVPTEGLSDAFGLWSYGALLPARHAGDAATRRWALRLPDDTAFTFRGRVVAEVVPTDSVEAVSRSGSATLVNRGVAYDAAGNGLAVWNASTRTGQRLLYSYRPAAAQAWSEPQELAIEVTTETAYGIPAKVVSNGTTFLVVWSTLAGMRCAVFTGGWPGAAQPLWTGHAILESFDVAASGPRYAVVRADTHQPTGAVGILDGTSWTWAAITTSPSDRPVVAPLGTTGFLFAVRATGGTEVWARRWTGAAWSAAAVPVPGATGKGTLVGPALATSGATAAIAWAPASGTVHANVDAGSGFGVPTEIGALAGPPTGLSAAGSAGNFAVAWVRAGGGAYASVYTPGSQLWSPPGELASGGKALAAKVAPSGSGFAAAFTLGEAGYGAPSLWLSTTVLQGTRPAFDPAMAKPVEGEPGDARDPLLAPTAAGVAVSWDQEDGTRPLVQVRGYTAAGSGGAPEVPSRGLAGSVREVRLARARSGEALAVWTQDHRGGPAVFAAVRVSPAGWGEPVLLDLNAHAPALASNGDGFMVAYARLDAGQTSPAPASNVVTRRFASGTFLPAEVVAPGFLPALASAGGTYAVAFTSGGAVWSSRYEGTWLPPGQRSGDESGVRDVAVAGGSGSYALVWTSSAGVRAARAAASGAWDAPQTLAPGSGYAPPAVAAGPGGFAVVYRSAGTVRAVLTDGPTWWGTATPLSSAGTGAAALASNGTSYLAAWATDAGVEVRAHDGTAWSAAAPRVAGPTLGLVLAAEPGGAYELLTSQGDGATTTLYAMDPLRDAPDTAWPLELAAEAVRPPGALVHDGTGWIAAWPAQSTDPIVDVLRARWF